MELPEIGLGTWMLKGRECTKVVRSALEIGYRHIDTAHLYENHKAVASAIQEFDRGDLYITSKVALDEWIDPLKIESSIQKSCEKALEELNTDYLDLYLIHAPDRSFPLEEIFVAMEKLKEEGKVEQVGVSNYTIHHLEDLAQAGYTPFANQVEFHPYLNQQDLFDYCLKHQIKLISFRPFGKGKLLSEEPLFDEIGVRYDKSGAQVILRWLIQKGIPVVPKASSQEHLRENFEIWDFSLSKEEMAKLDQLNQGKRYCRGDNPEYNY